MGQHGPFNDDAHAQKVLALHGKNHGVARNDDEYLDGFHHSEEQQNDVSCDEVLIDQILRSHDAKFDDDVCRRLVLDR